MLDSGDEGDFRAGLLDEPLGDFLAASIPVGTIRGLGGTDGSWLIVAGCSVDLQGRRAGGWRLPA